MFCTYRTLWHEKRSERQRGTSCSRCVSIHTIHMTDQKDASIDRRLASAFCVFNPVVETTLKG
jgi:hypothetical protein